MAGASNLPTHIATAIRNDVHVDPLPGQMPHDPGRGVATSGQTAMLPGCSLVSSPSQVTGSVATDLTEGVGFREIPFASG